ncbi:T9SS type A sorting domain-containing protein [bacterium]|nr:T9SS type A sorting domain-containing protein [bacterium]
MRMLRPFMFLSALLVIFAMTAQAQITSDTLTIQQIQQQPEDSLNAGITDSPHVGDTVTVEGVVIAAPRISQGGPPTFALGNAFTMYIMDPNGGPWSGLNVRASDSLAADAILFTVADTGFVVRFTGVVTQYYTTTQFEVGVGSDWNADVSLEILDDMGHRPDPTTITLGDLVDGGPQDDIPLGQQWEGAYVNINNVKVGSVNQNTSTGRYTWTILDGAGNSIGVYDQSVYFRGGSQGFDPNWAPPAPGTTISSIRGVISSSSQGIVIAPIYPGDMQLGSFPPIVSDLTRDIAIPTTSDAVEISCMVEDSNEDGSITDVTLVYGLYENDDNVEVDRLTMSYDDGTMMATASIPAQADGAIVWYYIEATDNDNETVVFPGDIINGRPFYIVRDGDLRIRDIQYTPYADGRSGAIAGEVSIRGTVVGGADDLGMVFIQDDSAPWSGLMVRGDESVRNLVTGQDVTVTGTVDEYYDVTAVVDASLTTDHGTATVPDAIELETGTFESDVVTNGNTDAEQWEGMLTVFKNLEVTSDNADDPAGNYGEILVNDGTGDMRADDIGTWSDTYTNDSTETGKTYLGPGKTIASLTGVSYYSFGNYKLEPRGEDDVEGIGTAEHPPVITDLKRNVAIPTSSDAVTVTCKVEDSNAGGTISKVEVVYGMAETESGRVELSYDESTTIATGSIPAMADGDVVWYYIEATDNDSEMATYPEVVTGTLPFFIVRDGNIRIWDIRYTPYEDGVPGCTGFENITTRGTLVAGPNIGNYFLQGAESEWSGIQIYSSTLKDEGLALGDDITVTGKVGVRYGVVQLSDVTIDENHGNVALPDPIMLSTGMFETAVTPDGDMDAEPYEGMLVGFEDLTVTSDNADAPNGNYGEFLVDDGSGEMRVDDLGTWDDVYTTDSTDTGLIYLKPGTYITGLTGLMYFAFDNFKLEPRSEDDFVDVITSLEHIPTMPNAITLQANYPNPFSAAAGTTIRFDIPQAGQASLKVYDLAGRLVATVVDGSLEAGSYTARFAAENMTPGMYLYRLTVNGISRTERMIVTR